MRRAAKRIVVDVADATEVVFRIGRQDTQRHERDESLNDTTIEDRPPPDDPEPDGGQLVTDLPLLDIVQTLAERGEPMTTEAILEAMNKRGCIHSETTIKRRLARAVSVRLLTSSRSGTQPGYGLLSWQKR